MHHFRSIPSQLHDKINKFGFSEAGFSFAKMDHAMEVKESLNNSAMEDVQKTVFQMHLRGVENKYISLAMDVHPTNVCRYIQRRGECKKNGRPNSLNQNQIQKAKDYMKELQIQAKALTVSKLCS